MRPPAPPRPEPPSLHSWLHPHAPPPTLARSPPLHHSSSTFLTFAVSFLPPSHVTTEAALAKEAKRIVRELDVVRRAGPELMAAGEGAFQAGDGRAPGRAPGNERAREPDHRMWACRALCLKEGKNGTEGEEAFQLVECFSDDGEKFGGERVLKVLREQNAVDVLSYGGDMIGPIRFQHIATTVQTSLKSLIKLVQLRDLRQTLDALDEEIASLRARSTDLGSSQTGPNVTKLQRLVSAKEKTVAVLLKKQNSTSA
ncbi:hypothetical protein CNBB2120 [Cryptococcus deneoformans B-3501A]|uniref:hypothetical protein n=1 Tax=Cryptococcus deneoformans (strain B-3501A) TaxID=283643 RepID=UPI000042E77D|nr:hypothetical protein CNBB2120 [Cryptococcus neoformans var. neoformans B-3501A]EAL22764.1 hypothetical protein CNBB2120 [Cryptococcus neoformans var. neoformans B-3501A]